jgi:DNA-binding IscR family transcriptional regulator
MIQDVLQLIRQSNGRPLSAEAIAGRLGLPPAVVQHMLLLLVQRGRLSPVGGACSGCDVCPLHRFCAGADASSVQGYVIRQ